MTINIPLTITNPSAETGDNTGWINTTGSLGTRSSNPVAYSGSFYFFGGANATTEAYQRLFLFEDGISDDDVDGGTLKLKFAWAQASYKGLDKGKIIIRFRDSGLSLISYEESSLTAVNVNRLWETFNLTADVPVGTRYVDIVLYMVRYDGTNLDAYFDNISCIIERPDITKLIDMSIDISTYQDVTNDNASVDIHVASWTSKNFNLDCDAAFQSIANTTLYIDTIGERIKNQKIDISVGSLWIENLILSMQLSKQLFKNSFLDIFLTDGITSQNAYMDISASDGHKKVNLGLDMMAVNSRPEFRYVYAMNLSSVIKEIAE